MEYVVFKEGVEVRPFDNNSNSNSYLLSYKGRHWRVSSFVVYVYEILVEAKNIENAYKMIIDKSDISVSYDKFYKVIDFFKKNGLFVGTADVGKINNSNRSLWGKFTVIPAKIVNKFKWLRVFFDKRIMSCIGILESVCFFYFFATYDSKSVISDLWRLNVGELCICILIIILFGLVHEFGHSVALMSYGQTAGAIGIGVYMYMPVFYSNVTNAWKLKRLQRMCVDIGGIYFQAFALCSVYLCVVLIDKDCYIKCAILISALQIIGNFNPFIKMDGYWIISDFLGVSNSYNIILEGIKNLFTKKKKKLEFDDMKKTTKFAFLIYSILIVGYFVYLIRLLAMLFVEALRQIIEDISNISYLTETYSGFGDVLTFLQTRISSCLVLVFVVRMIIILVRKILVFGSDNENNIGIRKG